MNIDILPPGPDARTVTVSFDYAGVTHVREVNACFDADGAYDEAATYARVDDVANGVRHKIDIGAIKNPELMSFPEPEPAPDVS
jgi:hypothetical protein